VWKFFRKGCEITHALRMRFLAEINANARAGKLRWASGAADVGFRSGIRTRIAELSSGGSLTVSNQPVDSVR
jgi:hypothetical protein